MTEVQSFEPVVGLHPRIIILGSMPGVASLQAVQYYAHPRNLFWPIMGNLFGFDHAVEYSQRVEQIRQLPVVLWDSLKSCYRPGSLDSRIASQTAIPNDIPQLVSRYPGIRAIIFNGATSEKFFKQLILPEWSHPELALLRMPSTSPANAGMTFEQKLEAWSELLKYVD